MLENRKDRAFFALFALASLIAWVRMLWAADHLGYFVDEVLFHSLAAFRLFTTGNYNALAFPRIFDPTLASDIFTTWPAGVVWLFGGPLFWQRVILAALAWVSAICLATSYLRWRGFGAPAALACAGVAWLLLLRFPYWHGFLQNLAELPGALWLGWGLYLHARGRPLWGSFCFGLAVWGSKVIFLPVAAAWLAAYVISSPGSLRRKTGLAAAAGAAFLAPLAPKLIYISAKFGLREGSLWLPRMLGFVLHGPSGLQEKGAMPGLFERLATLEWHTYGAAMKAKILLLLLAPAFLMPAGWLLRKRFGRELSRRELWFSLAAVAVLLAYTYWWFALHPQMFARHIQPALYVGFGFLLYWGSEAFSAVRAREGSRLPEMGVFALGMLIVAAELAVLPSSWPVIDPGGSYARNCRGALDTDACTPELERFRKVNEEKALEWRAQEEGR